MGEPTDAVVGGDPGVRVSRVVVIIPALNAADSLPRQLRALDHQTDLDFAVLVSDNGSTDGTAAIVANWSPRFRSLDLVDSSHRQGAAHARNVAVAASDAQLLLFCDADDEVGPRWVESLRSALQSSSAATGPLRLRWPGDPHRSEAWNADQAPVSMNHLPYMPGCNMAVRRTLFDEVGGFDPSYAQAQEDVEFGWRLAAHGYDIAHVPTAWISYFQRAGLWAHLRQQWRNGTTHVALYARHRDIPVPTASWKASVRWFWEWGRQAPAALRRGETREMAGSLAFQIARCLQSLRLGIRTPL